MPCFSRELLDYKDDYCKDLLLYWADFFNFAFRNLANEKDEKGFSAIKQKYDSAVRFLENRASYYCSLLNPKPNKNPLLDTVRTFKIETEKFY